MSDIVDKLLASIAERQGTPEGRAASNARFATWAEERKIEAGAAQAAELDILTVCKKHFPNKTDNLCAPEMLASAINHFDLDDSYNHFDMVQLYLEWTVESVVGTKLLECAPKLLEIWEMLVANNQFEDNRFEWNDADNHLFAIRETPPGKKVWCSTSQNWRFMFILEVRETLGITDVHVRRYWDAVEPACDKWEVEDRDKYAEFGYEYAVQHADWLKWNYSDNLLGNQYVDRPDLQWWKDCDYEPQYKDCRDVGYVMTLNLSRLDYGQTPRVDRAIYQMAKIKVASRDISMALITLQKAFAPEVVEVAPEVVEVAPDVEAEAPLGVKLEALEVGTGVIWHDDREWFGEITDMTGGSEYVCVARFSETVESTEEYVPGGETFDLKLDSIDLGNLRIFEIGGPDA